MIAHNAAFRRRFHRCGNLRAPASRARGCSTIAAVLDTLALARREISRAAQQSRCAVQASGCRQQSSRHARRAGRRQPARRCLSGADGGAGPARLRERERPSGSDGDPPRTCISWCDRACCAPAPLILRSTWRAWTRSKKPARVPACGNGWTPLKAASPRDRVLNRCCVQRRSARPQRARTRMTVTLSEPPPSSAARIRWSTHSCALSLRTADDGRDRLVVDVPRSGRRCRAAAAWPAFQLAAHAFHAAATAGSVTSRRAPG